MHADCETLEKLNKPNHDNSSYCHLFVSVVFDIFCSQFRVKVKVVDLQISNSNISIRNNLLKTMFYDIDFSEVTLVTLDNQHIPSHRSVLSASSPFLRRILFECLQQGTFLYLGMVESEIGQAIVNFILFNKELYFFLYF